VKGAWVVFLWAKKTRRGGVDFFFAGGWRFDEYRRDPPAVREVDWSTVRRGSPVVLTMVKRAKYHEREAGVFDAVFAGLDHESRPRFASTVEKATRLAHPAARLAFGDDEEAVGNLVSYVRRARASKALTRQLVSID
jgi:hypothetical protein